MNIVMDNKVKDRILSRLKSKLIEEKKDYRKIILDIAVIIEWKNKRENNIRELEEEIETLKNKI